jgi:hypothetical protein
MTPPGRNPKVESKEGLSLLTGPPQANARYKRVPETHKTELQAPSHFCLPLGRGGRLLISMPPKKELDRQ